jgi:hypothetical protein
MGHLRKMAKESVTKAPSEEVVVDGSDEDDSE